MGGRTLLTLSASVVSTAGFGGAPVEFGIDFGGVAIVRDTRQMVMMLAVVILMILARQCVVENGNVIESIRVVKCIRSRA